MMSVVYVQFSDEKETEIVSVFASPPDPDYYHFLGEVDESDERLTNFWKQFPQHGLGSRSSTP
ncbi:TPA: hypothetical protein ODN95_003340 [Escherichia coli]|uniref:hypothetical protein n=1 Tax=Escherichia coli TaxID=562 RepID=UPI00181ECA4E|nr:hypothetical protein [Escherichia coli]EFB3093237.1 hypothetical protein [Escherichia coli]EFB3733184.1 hypothetical protein [Escherichia coli]EFB4454234.1 hypothetical protein [Escherichia coli]EFB9869252.1 hypothetical protein [Escherichia coli]EFC6884436.1 hypothetical protein [Escherichia coli]